MGDKVGDRIRPIDKPRAIVLIIKRMKQRFNMPQKSKIAWTENTWNPVTGMLEQLKKLGLKPYKSNAKNKTPCLRLATKLEIIIRWTADVVLFGRKPFVNFFDSPQILYPNSFIMSFISFWIRSSFTSR